MLSTFNFQHNVGNVQELRLHKRGGQLFIYLLIFFWIVQLLRQSSTLFLFEKIRIFFCSKLGRALQSAPLANSYALLTYKRVGRGSFVAGVAWKGTVCAAKSRRVNINLYYGDATRTSEVRIEERQHNFFLNPSLHSHHILCLIDCCSRDRPQLEHESWL